MKKPGFHNSLGHAFRGLYKAARHERNFQLELLALFVNIFLIIWLKLSAVDTVVILIMCGGVLSLEMVNTAIEKICDFMQPEYDSRIKTIKDVAAGAVLLMALFAVAVALLVYPKYLI